MTKAQVIMEKLELQKALLQFERKHGRPVSALCLNLLLINLIMQKTRTEKYLMKPLYERYRLVKQIICTGMPLGDDLKTACTGTCTICTLAEFDTLFWGVKGIS